MRVVRVPYHLDEYLPHLDLPTGGGTIVTADMPVGDVWGRLGVLYSAVADVVADTAWHGDLPVVVSGDCMTALGTMAGLQRAAIDAGIIWFDAHGDLHTLKTTSSGYLGGMPLRLLVGHQPRLIAMGLGLQPVPEHRTVLVGARDLDPPEVIFLADAEIRRAEVSHLDATALPDGPLYVHLDADVIDPAVLPGLRYPAPGGPGTTAVASALGVLLSTGRVAAMGVACSWHPGHGAAAHLDQVLDAAFSWAYNGSRS
ncbi:MAG TPA: arginase family protein [Streptosporangiaceae bacterium]